MGAETAFEVGRLYGPIKAISDILTSSAEEIFIQLPGIEGYYPMSIANGSGQGINHTGAGDPLTQTGVVPIGFDGNAYRQLGSGTNYLHAASAYGLTGTETFISSSLRGFTIGGWFWVNSSPATEAGLISRDGSPGQRGYNVNWKSANNPQLVISVDGTATTLVDAPVSTLSEWHFIVGRFIPSTEIAVFVDGDKTVNTTSIPASCFVSSQQFEVGRYRNSGVRIIHAKCRDVFICRSALTDAQIAAIRTATAP